MAYIAPVDAHNPKGAKSLANGIFAKVGILANTYSGIAEAAPARSLPPAISLTAVSQAHSYMLSLIWITP